MEAHAGAIQAANIRLEEHDRRLIANHDSIATLRGVSARHDTKIEVITTELRETREDIAEMKSSQERVWAEQKGEMRWMRRGLWAAAGSFLVFNIALATVIEQLLT